MQRYALFCVVLLSAGCAGKQASSKPTAPPSAKPAAATAPDLSNAGTAEGSDVERIYQVANADKGPALGPTSAKVTLDVCSDFECPFCARLVPTLHELTQNYEEMVRVRWRNCPLPMHERALPASEAAMEVYAQGGDKAFWAYHDALFAHQEQLDVESLVKLAGQLPGIDTAKLRAALSDHRHVPAVQEDLRAVLDSGATAGGFGTPATFVNGRLISGAQPYEMFEDAVERALQETPEARAQAEAHSQASYPMATLRHILIQYQGARGADARITRSKEQAQALASDLHQRLITRSGTFLDLVKKHGDDPSAADGGLIGRITRGELMPQIDEVVFALKPGELSPVVETPFGYHVFLREQ